MKYALLLALALCGATTAQAQVYSGTISGTVRVVDGRAWPFTSNLGVYPVGANWSSPRFQGGTFPLSRSRVRVEVCQLIGPCVALETWASPAGNYSVNWATSSPAINARTRVLAMHQPLAAGSSYAFQVAAVVFGFTFPYELLASAVQPLPPAGTPLVINATAGTSEASAAWLTGRDWLTSLSTNMSSPLIASAMRDLTIQVNATGPFADPSGVAPTVSDVFIATGTATTAPGVLAHEMGHIAHWRLHSHTQAPIDPANGYNCDGVVAPAWTPFSDECERASFAEGFATFIEGAFLFQPTIDAAATASGMSLISSLDPSGTTFGCQVPGTGHPRAQCIGRALFDLYRFDTPKSLILTSLTAFCVGTANRCRGEPGLNGVNWADFRANYVGNAATMSVTTATRRLLSSAP